MRTVEGVTIALIGRDAWICENGFVLCWFHSLRPDIYIAKPDLVGAGISSIEDIGSSIERSKFVSGSARMRKRIETAWTMVKTMRLPSYPSAHCERAPPRIGEPQVKKMELMLYATIRDLR